MTISIVTHFNPFKLKLTEQPVQFCAEITNKGKETKKLTVELGLNHWLGFDRAVQRNWSEKEINEIKPGETKKMYWEIYASQTARAGEYPVGLVVLEYEKDKEEPKTKKTVKTHLSVVE